jgi:hypothetical protein
MFGLDLNHLNGKKASEFLSVLQTYEEFEQIGLDYFLYHPFDNDKFSFGSWDQTGASCCSSH